MKRPSSALTIRAGRAPTVFLAPLFLTRRYCRHCVKVVYKREPQNTIWEYELERMPPLGRFDGRAFLPDLPLLLMFDHFAMDGSAFERLRSKNAPPWLGAWPELAGALHSEGVLQLVDSDAAMRTTSKLRAAMLRRDLHNPSRWSNAMGYHDALLADARRALYRNATSSKARIVTWEFASGHEPGAQGPDGHTHVLSMLLDPTSAHAQNPAHAALVPQALDELRSQLRDVNAAIATSASLGLSPMLWAPYHGYLNAKLSQAAESNESFHQQQAARLFFKIAFPRYAPSALKEFLRLRRDRRLATLRAEILRAHATSDVIDPTYPQRAIEEVVRAERKAGKLRTIIGVISALVGVIPVPFLGVAATALSEVVSRAAEARVRKKLEWLYLMSDGTGHT